MKFKTLVILGSLLVLLTLTVYVSVYAWNAYGYASKSGGGAGCNGWGLVNGTYSVKVEIGGKVPPPGPDGEPHIKAGPYDNGNKLSKGVSHGNPDNLSVYGEGYISGVEPDGTPRREAGHGWYPGGK